MSRRPKQGKTYNISHLSTSSDKYTISWHITSVNTHTCTRTRACTHVHTHTHTHTHTNEILLYCTISATGVVAGEQPQPSRPRMVGLGGEIVSKY